VILCCESHLESAWMLVSVFVVFACGDDEMCVCVCVCVCVVLRHLITMVANAVRTRTTITSPSHDAPLQHHCTSTMQPPCSIITTAIIRIATAITTPYNLTTTTTIPQLPLQPSARSLTPHTHTTTLPPPLHHYNDHHTPIDTNIHALSK